jgi:hypothetical protein
VHLVSAVYRIALLEGLSEILSFCLQNEFIHLGNLALPSQQNIFPISQAAYIYQIRVIHFQCSCSSHHICHSIGISN